MPLSTEDKNLIAAWKLAAQELGLEITTPFIMNTVNGKVYYPLLVKKFGRRKGTIIARHSLFMDYPMPKDKDYYFSAVNAEHYSNYDKANFIETLEDWGYFGQQSAKPEWYNGYVYE